VCDLPWASLAELVADWGAGPAPDPTPCLGRTKEELLRLGTDNLEQGMPNMANESVVLARVDMKAGAECAEAEEEAGEKGQLMLIEVLWCYESICRPWAVP
jgi:hypothetical protein